MDNAEVEVLDDNVPRKNSKGDRQPTANGARMTSNPQSRQNTNVEARKIKTDDIELEFEVDPRSAKFKNTNQQRQASIQ